MTLVLVFFSDVEFHPLVLFHFHVNPSAGLRVLDIAAALARKSSCLGAGFLGWDVGGEAVPPVGDSQKMAMSSYFLLGGRFQLQSNHQ